MWGLIRFDFVRLLMGRSLFIPSRQSGGLVKLVHWYFQPVMDPIAKRCLVYFNLFSMIIMMITVGNT